MDKPDNEPKKTTGSTVHTPSIWPKQPRYCWGFSNSCKILWGGIKIHLKYMKPPNNPTNRRSRCVPVHRVWRMRLDSQSSWVKYWNLAHQIAKFHNFDVDSVPLLSLPENICPSWVTIFIHISPTQILLGWGNMTIDPRPAPLPSYQLKLCRWYLWCTLGRSWWGSAPYRRCQQLWFSRDALGLVGERGGCHAQEPHGLQKSLKTRKS